MAWVIRQPRTGSTLSVDGRSISPVNKLKALLAVDRMKRSHEKRKTQQQIHMIQSKVLEVTQ
jgi:hypothetical protein